MPATNSFASISRRNYFIISGLILLGLIIDFTGNFLEQNGFQFGYFTLAEIISRLCYTAAIGWFVAIYVSGRILDKRREENEELLNRQKEELDSQLEEQRQNNEKQLGEIRKAINQDVFDSLFKSLTPPNLFEAFKEDILRKKILVSEAEWDLCFTEESVGSVKLIQIIEYTMENLSQEQLIEPMVITVVDSPDSKLSLLSAFGKVNGSGEEWEYQKGKPEPENVKIETLDAEKGDGERIQINLEIPARGTIKLRLEFEAFYPERVNDVYFTKYPITSGRIDATFPPDYEFGVFASMSGRMIREYARMDKSKWKLEGVALPKQGFAFYLKKKSQL